MDYIQDTKLWINELQYREKIKCIAKYIKMLAVTKAEFGGWIMVHYFASLQLLIGGDNTTLNKSVISPSVTWSQ